MTLSNRGRISKPLADDVDRELLGKLRLPSGSETVEDSRPDNASGPFNDSTEGAAGFPSVASDDVDGSNTGQFESLTERRDQLRKERHDPRTGLWRPRPQPRRAPVAR